MAGDDTDGPEGSDKGEGALGGGAAEGRCRRSGGAGGVRRAVVAAESSTTLWSGRSEVLEDGRRRSRVVSLPREPWWRDDEH